MPYQYSETEMQGKILRLLPALWLNRLRYGRFLDILIAHAPPRGIHDGVDLAHRGFDAFLKLMDHWRPRYLLHGHKHIYQPQAARTSYRSTTVINVYPATVVDWSEP